MRKLVPFLLLDSPMTHGCIPITPAEIHDTILSQKSPELRSPELIIIYDNNPYDNHLNQAWGFSCLVRLPRKNILFDSGGDSYTLLHNMGQLEINPEEIDAVVLSHIDGDHVGGLSGFLQHNSAVTVYLPGSFPQSFKDELRSLGVGVVEVAEARELMPGVYTTGELDDGVIEQSLIITTRKGLVIITGCAHPGIVNVIRRAKGIAPNDSVYLAVGGWHLSGASPAQIRSIIGSFDQLGVERAAPCHCSGDETRRLFKEHYGEAYIESGVGRRIPLP